MGDKIIATIIGVVICGMPHGFIFLQDAFLSQPGFGKT